jgi:GT2 family glycosyltransferase
MYFAHQEEIDLCWRAFNENYKTIYIGKSTVYHVGGASLSHSHWKKTFLNFRNSLFNLIKNASGNVVWLVFQRLIMDGMAGVKFLMEGKAMHTWAIVKAHFSFYKHVPTLVRKRKKTALKKKDYYKIKNIVWQHFIKHKKLFKEL